MHCLHHLGSESEKLFGDEVGELVIDPMAGKGEMISTILKWTLEVED